LNILASGYIETFLGEAIKETLAYLQKIYEKE
jgi:hypothetical protein